MSRFGDYTFDPTFEMPTAPEPPEQPATPPPPTTKDDLGSYTRFRVPCGRSQYGELEYQEVLVSERNLPVLAQHIGNFAKAMRRYVEVPFVSGAATQMIERYLHEKIMRDAFEARLSVLSIGRVMYAAIRGGGVGAARVEYLATPMVEWKEQD